ncbi:coiled-coil domain-containing glutamate-rich protein 1 [Ctenodactylus gundi]
MTQTLYKKEDPLNLGGGWSSSQAPPGTWSSRPRRRKGAPIYKAKRQYRHRRRAGYAASRKQPKHQHGRSPWFWPPAQHCWPAGPNWGLCAGPWLPPPVAFPKLPCPAQMRRLYGTPSLCACCCSCWWRPWHPGWAWPPGARKRRWGRRSHLRRPRRHPPVDLNSLLRPVNLYGWRAPGMRAPPNTTQYIMNQVYEDMRQQELQERQQGPGWDVPSPGDPAGRGAPCSGGEEDPGLPGALYGLEHDPSLLLSPAPVEKSQSPPSQLLGEEERNEGEGDEYEEEVCDGEEEEEEVEEEEEESCYESSSEEQELASGEVVICHGLCNPCVERIPHGQKSTCTPS